jgi:hypothetical protein
MVLGDRVVVHVGDDNCLRVAGAGRVVDASYLKIRQAIELVKQWLNSFLAPSPFPRGQDTVIASSSEMEIVVLTLTNLVARAAALAVLEEGLVAAGSHGREGRQVHVLESAGATCMEAAAWKKVHRPFKNTTYKQTRDQDRVSYGIHAPAMAWVRTVIVRAGPGRRTIPGGPGSLPIGVGSEGGGVKVYWPGAGAIGEKEGEDCSKCNHVEWEGNHLVIGG